MDRRSFLSKSGAIGTAAMGVLMASKKAAASQNPDYYELRAYQLETPAQQEQLDLFLEEAFIPAANRAGIKPVGVFRTSENTSPVYVLLRHENVESVAGLTRKLLTDTTFLRQGKTFLEAPASAPAYKRMECSLLVAFDGMPHLEMPVSVSNEGRVFQLRIYESPSVRTGQKKIEMFNRAEMAIFRKTGLNPVFFGQCLIGGKMPNLTYMLAFKNMEEQKAGWKRFVDDPSWKELKAVPEYADDKILCGITNINLVPMSGSQI